VKNSCQRQYTLPSSNSNDHREIIIYASHITNFSLSNQYQNSCLSDVLNASVAPTFGLVRDADQWQVCYLIIWKPGIWVPVHIQICRYKPTSPTSNLYKYL